MAFRCCFHIVLLVVISTKFHRVTSACDSEPCPESTNASLRDASDVTNHTSGAPAFTIVVDFDCDVSCRSEFERAVGDAVNTSDIAPIVNVIWLTNADGHQQTDKIDRMCDVISENNVGLLIAVTSPTSSALPLHFLTISRLVALPLWSFSLSRLESRMQVRSRLTIRTRSFCKT